VVALCGDGSLASNELCDDGNTLPGDGCSPRCRFELGYKCAGAPSVCSPSVCGDDNREGAESCDDGNAVPPDGCSAECPSEPDRSAGECRSDGGDGLVIDEECDDGNTLSGDGCSSTCQRRPVSMVCSARSATAPRRTARCVCRRCIGTSLRLTSTFTAGEKPRPSIAARTIPSSLALLDDGTSRFVNPFGPNGERWVALNGTALHGNPVFCRSIWPPMRKRMGAASRQSPPNTPGTTTGMPRVTLLRARAATTSCSRSFMPNASRRGSSFQLTLSGFENTPSRCEPRCGDGIVSLGEECDDLSNDGGYGECEPGCKVGPRCGDRIVQAGEDCDDGNRLDGDGCGSACRNLVLR
jgi:cysteine-rich repeat protein